MTHLVLFQNIIIQYSASLRKGIKLNVRIDFVNIMSFTNLYNNTNLKLESRKRLIWLFSVIAIGIYSIIVFILLFLVQLPIWVQLVIIYSYMVIAPLALYSTWFLFYIWKTRKWPQSEKLFGGKFHYTLLLLLIGVCVINWAAYWNTGLGEIWYIFAIGVYDLTGNELLASVIYVIGASAITPALGEEFLKSLPSIIAFFVVLQRDKNPEQKRKGLLGNELGGFLFGLIIGITFEIIELLYYLLFTMLSGGGTFAIYLQVTARNWAPIHILGGAMGGFAAGRAERLRYERGEENLPMSNQIMNFIKRFTPLWLIPVSIHFLWNSSNVWIFLFILAVGGGMLLYLVLEIIVLVTLSVLCFILLLLLLRRANKIATLTFRCPETGMVVAKEGVICSSFSDKIGIAPAKIPSDRGIVKQGTEIICPNCNKITISRSKFCVNCGYNLQHHKFCPNCSRSNKFGTKFCVHCGFQLRQLKASQIYLSSDDTPSKSLLIVSLIITSFFLFYIIAFSILVFIINPIMGIIYLAFQTSIELVAAGLMFYTIIKLFKMRKNFNGRENMWYWHILLFNLIGIFGMLLIYGIYGLIYGVIALTFGVISIAMPLSILFLAGATLLFIFLLNAILKSNRILHYQRNY